MDILLSPTESRVLGALMEKEYLVPDIYPLSLNALVTACNQTSSRDPVVSYDEQTVMAALDSLRAKKLTVTVMQAGSRVAKFQQQLSLQLNLHQKEQAVLCLLMLRGPQTVGELKSRSGRLYEFTDLSDVEASLIRLAEDRYPARVEKLPRQPGMKESRYRHTLCAAEELQERELTVAERLLRLEEEVATLRAELAQFRQQFD